MTTNRVKAVRKPGTVQVSNAWSYAEVADYLGERPYPERCPEFRELVRRCYVPVVPEDRLFLPVTGLCDVARFAGLLRKVWERIPAECRQVMVAYWRDDDLARVAKSFSPRIELAEKWCVRCQRFTEAWLTPDQLDDWPAFHKRPVLRRRVKVTNRDDGAIAEVASVGHVIRFAAVELDDWPGRKLRNVIAHEFAHVFQFASGEIPRVVWEDLDTPIEIDEDMGEVDIVEVEQDANAIAEGWGFVQDRLD